MLKFSPQTGLTVEDADAVRTHIQKDWRSALGVSLDIDASTAAGQLIDSETAIVVDKDSQILYLSNQFDPENNDGIWQDAIGHIYFMNRQIAQSSIVSCDCTGLVGTVIPQNSLVQTVDNVTLYALDTVTIPSTGLISLSFSAKETGGILIAPNTVNKIITVIPGWDTVNNTIGAVVGRDVESRADFEKRRALSVAKNSHGSLISIQGELTNVHNVVSAFVIENNTSAPITEKGVIIDGHSLFMSVKGGNNDDIAEAIYNKKDAGCGTTGSTFITHIEPVTMAQYKYKIERPADILFGIKVSLYITPETPSDIEARLKTALLNDFNGISPNSTRVGIGDSVRAASFYCIALNVGTYGLTTIKLTARFSNISSPTWGDEIEINADEFPVLLEENIIIEIISPT